MFTGSNFTGSASTASTVAAGQRELCAVRARFCSLVARWRLTQGELRVLLGLDAIWPAPRVLPDVIDARAETSMRLLLRLDGSLWRVIPDDGDVADWLRWPTRLYDGATPLQAMADVRVLRAIVRAVEERVG